MKWLSTTLFAAVAFVLLPGVGYAQVAGSDGGAMPDAPIYIIMSGTAFVVAAAFGAIVFMLWKGEWSLANSLKEPQPPPAAGSATPTTAPVGNDSSSRLIALLGMVMILIMFVSVGLVGIWTFAKTGKADLSNFQNYFLAGATLFVPYVFNQIKKIGQ
jgi:hypothetical protein